MENFSEIRTYLDTLGSLAKDHTAASAEEKAIRMAASALLYLYVSNQIDSYKDFVASIGKPLDTNQGEFLRKMGLS